MEKFLPETDLLATRIDKSAAELYNKLRELKVEELGLPNHCLHYYQASHATRLFFSIETSARLLYKSFSLIRRAPEEVIIMDYGAGVGTLYLLAKMISCKQVVYNDHLEDWKQSAELIANAIGIHIDHYVVGDIEDCFDRLDKFNIVCDLITSRNVIEHIYQLDKFYNTIRTRQPNAFVVSSTTANSSNPIAVVKHRLWHRKWEKVYRGKRLVMIGRQAHGLTPMKSRILAVKTQGLAGEELKEAIEAYRRSGKLPDPSVYRTNTCEPSSGVWAEHLLTKAEYGRIIENAGFASMFAPGFWDTHYVSLAKNKMSTIINKIIARNERSGIRLAPFIYVIAIPR